MEFPLCADYPRGMHGISISLLRLLQYLNSSALVNLGISGGRARTSFRKAPCGSQFTGSISLALAADTVCLPVLLLIGWFGLSGLL